MSEVLTNIAANAADDKESPGSQKEPRFDRGKLLALRPELRPSPEDIANIVDLKQRGWVRPVEDFYRFVLPADAFQHRDSEITVFPDFEGGWAVFETCGDGGSQYRFASKEAALAFALDYMRERNAELKVVNWSIYERKPGEADHAD